MEVLHFVLKGETAFFKKPDVNTYLYFTYGNIHKVALLGLFGAILGYQGYNQMAFNEQYKKRFDKLKDSYQGIYPEFYQRLCGLMVSIVPKQVSFNKKVQVYNNSVGYASKEQGGNLIVKEQWLENPSWDIYILIDHNEAEKLKDALINNHFVFIPYLGKNDHMAIIEDTNIYQSEEVKSQSTHIDCLCIMDDFLVTTGHDENELSRNKLIFKYEERLPVAINEKTYQYTHKDFIYTNVTLKNKANRKVYQVGNKHITFH